MKRKIASVLSLVMLVILVSGLQACKHERQDAQAGADTTKQTPGATAPPELKITSIKNTEELKELNASIKSETAQLSGSDARSEKFNKAISDFVGKEVKSFKTWAGQEKKERADSGQLGFELDLSYDVKYSAKNLVSVLYKEYTFTGGAHGNNSSSSFNYDLDRGEMLELAHLFIPDSNYLKTISDYCSETLKGRKISDDDWIKEGAGADKKNYSTWNIVSDGLLVTFDSYQVAAYAEGPQEVVVPFSVLKGIIKPGGPLAAIVK
jgi:hypothetical protein